MADSPLRSEDYAIYSAIFEDEQITPTGMAHRLGMPLTTVMDHVARLEARGHARRTVNPRDRRATQIVLTANGLAAHRAANRSFEKAYASFVAAMAVDNETATQWLSLIRDAVEEAASAAAREPSASAAAQRLATTAVHRRSRR